ncbi:hypothetical protein PXC01_00965 [Maribacter sp. M208]|uniref:hypothetical protein n=1 Tax=Maribacter huludaoensis TaxID=3030010 RepID=UPI0023EE041B|nr:hypothetical protein [Maribacter huludaoensis]MDF4220136.1 hypothetical protein [Maribacter huludaoensis]
MNRIVFGLVLFFSVSISAQKIGFKKGAILVDKVAIPIKMETEHRATKTMGDYDILYSFTNSNSSELFLQVNSIGRMLVPNGAKESWLEISNADFSKTNAIDIDPDYGTGKKKIISFLIEKLQFFDLSGNVNAEKISTFLDTKTESTAKEKVNKVKNQDKELDAKVAAINPFVQNDLSITKGGRMGTDVIGKVTSPDEYSGTRSTPIKVYDVDGNLIATATTDIQSPVKVSLQDGSSFEYKAKRQLSKVTKQEFLTELIGELIKKGNSPW